MCWGSVDTFAKRDGSKVKRFNNPLFLAHIKTGSTYTRSFLAELLSFPLRDHGACTSRVQMTPVSFALISN